MDDFEIKERRKAFNHWLATYGRAIGYFDLSPKQQGTMHEALRRAFNAGQHYEAQKNEPVKVGGRL